MTNERYSSQTLKQNECLSGREPFVTFLSCVSEGVDYSHVFTHVISVSLSPRGSVLSSPRLPGDLADTRAYYTTPTCSHMSFQYHYLHVAVSYPHHVYRVTGLTHTPTIRQREASTVKTYSIIYDMLVHSSYTKHGSVQNSTHNSSRVCVANLNGIH